jgi:5-formyltetrahydrofolate cyclo-ligase
LPRAGWQAATPSLAYPDYVLRPLRRSALERGIHVVVPARHRKGWRLLSAGEVNPRQASTIAGAETFGRALETPPPCRMLFLACVALDEDGHALDKGYGFKPGADLPAATIVHPLQLFARLPQPSGRVIAYATPEHVSDVARQGTRTV